MDRLPLEMLEGEVVISVKRIPAKITYYFTDGTFAVVETGVPDDVEQKLSSIELALSEHMEHTAPPAHTGLVVPNVPLRELTVKWYANPDAILMQSNNSTQAISNVFELVLEVSNHTVDTFSDIKIQAIAENGMVFMDASRDTNLPAPQGISGTHNSAGYQLQGFKLQPGESGYFKLKVQQTVGTPILGPTPFGAQLIDLSYVKSGQTARQQIAGLPMNAPFNLIP